MAEQKGMCSSSPARTPKLQLTTEQPLTRECWILPEKDTPHPGAKEEPQHDYRIRTHRVVTAVIVTIATCATMTLSES